MRRKKETNLFDDRGEVGMGVLGLDDEPEPEHRRAIRDIRRLRLTRTASKESNEAAKAVYNDRARVSDLGERARVVIIGKNSHFHRIPMGLVGEVLARIREKSNFTTNGCEGGKAAFDDVEALFAVVIHHVGMAQEFFGYDISELEEAFGWPLEPRPRIGARVHFVDELGGVDLRP